MKIDWKSVGQMALVAVGAVIVLRSVESAFPQVQTVTRLPDKLLGMIPGAK